MTQKARKVFDNLSGTLLFYFIFSSLKNGSIKPLSAHFRIFQAFFRLFLFSAFYLSNNIKKNGRVKFDKKHGTQLADSMVKNVHMMLHEALDMAVKQLLLVSNPTNGTTLPKNNYAPKQILNDEQLDKFMNQIRQDESRMDISIAA